MAGQGDPPVPLGLRRSRVTISQKRPLATGFRSRLWRSGPQVLAVLTVTAGVWLTHGVELRALASYGAYLLLVIVLPGRAVWRWAFSRASAEASSAPSRLEQWVGGAAVGYVIELVAYPVARWLGHPHFFVLLPLLLWALSWFAGRTRALMHDECELGRGASWSLAAILMYLAVWLGSIAFTRYPLRPYRILDEDEQFHLALIAELRHHFPPQYPYVDAGGLTYQWFVHAHTAASTWLTGLEPLVIYRRFDVLVLSALCVLGTAVLTMRLSGRAWPGAAAAAALVLVGTFDITGAAIGQAVPEERFMEAGLLLNSPTQTFGFALALPVALLCQRWLQPNMDGARASRPVFVGMVMGFAALAGTKVTFLPIFACGFLTASIAGALWHSSRIVRAIAGALSTFLVAAVSALVLYGGDSQSLKWAPGATSKVLMSDLGLEPSGIFPVAVVTASLLAGWLLNGIGAVGLARDTSTRTDPRVWWLIGTVVSGYGATMLLSHGGMSQLYFGRSVAPFVAVLAGWGLSQLFPRGTPSRVAIAALAASAAAGVSLLAVRTVTERARDRQVVDGELVTGPLFRTWINLPALVTIVVLLLLIRAVVRDLSRGRVIIAGCLVIAFLSGLGLARPMAFILGRYPEVSASSNRFLGAGAIDAARWLRDHSGTNDRVMTNAHCLTGDIMAATCDSRHFWMSAFSERRFVLEGWAYTRHSVGWKGPFWGHPRWLRDNDRVFTAPTDRRSLEYLRRRSVDWVIVDRREGHDLDALASASALRLAHVSGQFTIFRVSSLAVPERFTFPGDEVAASRE